MVGGFEGFFLGWGGGEINDDLRRFSDDMGEFCERFACFCHNFTDYKAGEHAVAGGFAWKDDVTGLFAADIDIVGAHSFGDIGIADRCDFGVDVILVGPVDEALISHYGDGDFV